MYAEDVCVGGTGVFPLSFQVKNGLESSLLFRCSTLNLTENELVIITGAKSNSDNNSGLGWLNALIGGGEGRGGVLTIMHFIVTTP